MIFVFGSEKEETGQNQKTIFDPYLLRLIRASRLKGHELIENKIYGKEKGTKIVNLQNAEVTKMLDTKTEQK